MGLSGWSHQWYPWGEHFHTLTTTHSEHFPESGHKPSDNDWMDGFQLEEFIICILMLLKTFWCICTWLKWMKCCYVKSWNKMVQWPSPWCVLCRHANNFPSLNGIFKRYLQFPHKLHWISVFREGTGQHFQRQLRIKDHYWKQTSTKDALQSTSFLQNNYNTLFILYATKKFPNYSGIIYSPSIEINSNRLNAERILHNLT